MYMVFSSLLFIYLFLPLQLIIYSIVPQKSKNASLLFFSLVFYAWSGPLYLLILICEALICWFFAKKIEDTHRKLYLIIPIVALLSILAFFKYLGLASNALNVALGLCSSIQIPELKVALPIGISFYTFQLITYVVDVYRKKANANRSFYKVLLYASLFHQCIAGPIVRYETVANEIESRAVSLDDVFYGVRRFSIGLAKKAVLANSCAEIADKLLSQKTDVLMNQSVSGLWLGAIAYTLQIYLDFSAYSDMAIGMGRMVGFHYLENFNYPYISKSVKEFWRRWHISLSTFFRDYVYIPLGGNRTSAIRHIFNLFIVWFLTGLWHGASVNFICWGIYYFVFLMFEKYILRDKTIPVIGNVYTLLVVVVGWVMFRFESFAQMKLVLRGMFGLRSIELWDMNVKSLFISNMFFIVLAIVLSTPIISCISRYLGKRRPTIARYLGYIDDLLVPAILLLLSTIALVGNSYNPFLYFRF